MKTDNSAHVRMKSFSIIAAQAGMPSTLTWYASSLLSILQTCKNGKLLRKNVVVFEYWSGSNVRYNIFIKRKGPK